MKIRQLGKWYIAVGIIILFVVIAMIQVNQNASMVSQESSVEEIQENFETEAIEEITEPPLPVLDSDQIEILDKIMAHLEEENLQEAAMLLQKNEQKLQYIFYQVLEGQRYLYADGMISEELDGKGLVLKKSSAVFYGELSEGKPEGTGIVLQVIKLEAPRYDYSMGTWEQGMMTGHGTIGYHYYEGVNGEENKSVQKEGLFAEDMIEGDFIYRTTSAEGDTTIWDMSADAGRTVIDERWIYEDDKQSYCLPSNQNQSHTYVLPEAAVYEVRWRNMLLWSE